MEHEDKMEEVKKDAAREFIARSVVFLKKEEAVKFQSRMKNLPMVADPASKLWIWNAGTDCTKDPARYTSPYRMKGAADAEHLNLFLDTAARHRDLHLGQEPPDLSGHAQCDRGWPRASTSRSGLWSPMKCSIWPTSSSIATGLRPSTLWTASSNSHGPTPHGQASEASHAALCRGTHRRRGIPVTKSAST